MPLRRPLSSLTNYIGEKNCLLLWISLAKLRTGVSYSSFCAKTRSSLKWPSELVPDRNNRTLSLLVIHVALYANRLLAPFQYLDVHCANYRFCTRKWKNCSPHKLNNPRKITIKALYGEDDDGSKAFKKHIGNHQTAYNHELWFHLSWQAAFGKRKPFSRDFCPEKKPSR